MSVIRIFRLLLERLEQITDAVRGECKLAKDAHDFDNRPANLEVVFDDSNEAVSNDGNVYLDTHCVLGLSPKSFDLKMLFNPFEKQLHLPPILVKQGDVLGTEEEVVRVIDETAVQLRSIIDDSPDSTRVLLQIPFLVKRMLWSLSTLSVPSRMLSPSTISYAGLPFSLIMKEAPNT